MKKPIIIGDIQFKSIKSATDFVRRKLTQLGCCAINLVDDQPDFNFFMNLIKRHHEYKDKISCGVREFIITNNPYGNGLQLSIRRMDDSVIDISWHKCIHENLKNQSENNLKQAMRTAIRDQILDFRDSQQPLICQNCGIYNHNTKYHVDHNNPSFRTLYTHFTDLLRDTDPGLPQLFDDDPKYGCAKFKNEDVEFEEVWQLYHQTYCNLQILCETCNLSKAKD